MRLFVYFANIPMGKMVLWCYLIWYLVNIAALFDPSPVIWLNSAGISIVIGFALLLSVSGGTKPDRWQTFRLFLMPFCVSSFASLIKGRGYILVFPSDTTVLAASFLACASFLVVCATLRRFLRRDSQNARTSSGA